MTLVQSLVLGALQGFTEFLPVSSSGHLALAQRLFGLSDPPIAFDVFLHFATMLATLLYFMGDILSLLKEWLLGFVGRDRRKSEGWRYGWAVIAGTLVTALLGLPLEGAATRAFAVPWAVACGLVVTASLLGFASRIPVSDKQVSLGTGILVGLAQGIAVMPGISRSGSTIVAALMAGVRREEAFRFSFLLSLPAIMGATLLEGLKALREGVFLPDGWAYGCALAFLCGLVSLHFMRKVVVFGKWKYFSLYCLVVAAIGFIIGLL